MSNPCGLGKIIGKSWSALRPGPGTHTLLNMVMLNGAEWIPHSYDDDDNTIDGLDGQKNQALYR